MLSRQRHFSTTRPPRTAEEGETIGTLTQFADDFQATPMALLQCAERRDRAIVLSSGEGAPIVLILDPDSRRHLSRCARNTPV